MTKYFILLLALFVAVSAFSQSNSIKKNEKTVTAIFKNFDNKNSPGVAVAVLKDGKIVYKKCFGSANLEYETPIQPNSVFQIASLAKQFTAFGIALLADKGKISIEDDVRKYIPELPNYGKKITISNLLTHTSGIKDQWDLLYLAGWKTDDIITNDDALNLIFKQKELNFETGTQFSYSNAGYSLLALIIQRVSGQSFAEFMQENIFVPLKMNNSFFLENNNLIVKNKAYSYKNAENGFEKELYNATTIGPNGLHTSLDDLCLWVKNYDAQIVGNKAIMNEISKIPTLKNATLTLQLGYGYGQDITTYRGEKMISHDGSDAGYKTYISRFPNQNFSVNLLSNVSSFDAVATAVQIADIYLAEVFKEPTKVEKGQNQVLFLPDNIEKAIEGDYKINDTLTFRINVFDHNIMAENAQTKQRLYFRATSNNEFVNKKNAIFVKYLKKGKNKNDALVFTIKNKIDTVSKATNVDASYLKEFTGEYYSEALSAKFTLLIKNQRLFVIQPRGRAIKIAQTDIDEFSGEFWWLNTVNFIRNEAGTITGFEVNNNRTKKVYFNKDK